MLTQKLPERGTFTAAISPAINEQRGQRAPRPESVFSFQLWPLLG